MVFRHAVVLGIASHLEKTAGFRDVAHAIRSASFSIFFLILQSMEIV